MSFVSFFGDARDLWAPEAGPGACWSCHCLFPAGREAWAQGRKGKGSVCGGSSLCLLYLSCGPEAGKFGQSGLFHVSCSHLACGLAGADLNCLVCSSFTVFIPIISIIPYTKSADQVLTVLFNQKAPRG